MRQIGRRFLVAGAFALGLLALAPSGPVMAAAGLNIGDDHLALKGYDPVAYFLADRPVIGDSRYEVRHEGAVYRFASAGNMALFRSDPERFLPEYGGYCSYGVRLGRKFDVDPHAWRIVEGRLFLQLDQGTQVIWLKDLNRNISIADSVWPQIREKHDSELAN